VVRQDGPAVTADHHIEVAVSARAERAMRLVTGHAQALVPGVTDDPEPAADVPKMLHQVMKSVPMSLRHTATAPTIHEIVGAASHKSFANRLTALLVTIP
jgi:hypothetical protein